MAPGWAGVEGRQCCERVGPSPVGDLAGVVVTSGDFPMPARAKRGTGPRTSRQVLRRRRALEAQRLEELAAERRSLRLPRRARRS